MIASSRAAEGPFVILSPEDWGDLAPTNKHQLARALAVGSEVMYFNVAPSRRTRLWPFVEVKAVSADGSLKVADSVGIPVRLRLRTRGMLSVHLAAASVGARLASASLSRAPSTVLVYFPMPYRFLRAIGAETIVYHCVDHHASFPGSQHVAEALLAWERDLVQRSDLVLASSSALATRLSEWRPDVHLLENVGDVDLFAQAGERALHRQITESNKHSPTVFFHGTLSSHKINLELMESAARLPSAPRLHIVGDAVDEATADRMRRLAQNPNVCWEPSMNQKEVTERLAEADLLIMPYALNEHTNYVFPIKLTEYLATGLPIISTPLGSIRGFCGNAVEYADGSLDVSEAFQRAGSQASRSSDAVRRRRALVAGRTWTARAEEIRTLLRVLAGDTS